VVRAVPLTATPSAPPRELTEARQKYEDARVGFDDQIDTLAASGHSDDEVRAIHEALSSLTEAEAQFHSALRAYAQSVRDRARAV
jgi:hypothetical protein